MPFNTVPMVLRNHASYLQAQFLEAVKGRTPVLVYGYWDSVRGGYLDECGYHCPFCDGSYEDEIHAAAELDNDILTFESSRDLRSPMREKQRQRKIRENKSERNSYKGRKEWQAYCRQKNKKLKRERVRLAVQESQNVVALYTLGFKPAKHQATEWDIRIPENLDKWVSNMNDDLVRYTLFGQNAALFESHKSYIEVGEDFSTWCQRRVAEMRGVKESRLLRCAPLTAKPMLWKRSRRNATTYDIFTGDASTTTLATNSYDALGHALLRALLTPSLRAIDGYSWFGEYEWAWHRNISGCWEFGHATYCTKEEGDWRRAPLPCAHCCGESYGFFTECYCRDFEGCTAPEEMQKCSLVEWVDVTGRRLIASDDASSGMCALERKYRNGSDGGWDLVSRVSSETWSVVDVGA